MKFAKMVREMGEIDSLFRATASVVRLDERLANSDLSGAYREWLLTNEAIGVMRMSGLEVRESDLVSYIAGMGVFSSKSVRMANDMRKSLDCAVSINLREYPSSSVISDMYEILDGSNVKRSGESLDGIIENDAVEVSELLRLYTSPDPWTASDGFKKILMSKKFNRQSKKMAILMSYWLFGNGFGVGKGKMMSFASSFLRESVKKEIDEETVDDDDVWNEMVFDIVDKAARRSLDVLISMTNLEKEMISRIEKKGKGSKSIDVIRSFIGRPMWSVVDLKNKIGSTYQGCLFIMEELEKNGVVSKIGDGKERNYVMKKAMMI